MTPEEYEMIAGALKASTEALLKAQEALECMWKGIDYQNEEYGDCVDECPNNTDNKYYKKARKLCKELGIEGNYCYHGEYHGE